MLYKRATIEFLLKQIGYYNERNNKIWSRSYTENEITEYMKTRFCPRKYYQIIKDDDFDAFTQFVTEKSSGIKFNEKINLLMYERNSDIQIVHNYILINSNSTELLTLTTARLSIIGGNLKIIHKCFESIKIIFIFGKYLSF